MKITTYKYEKVPVKDTEIFIPEETFYCFQTYIRRSIKIEPQFVTWDTDPNKKVGDVFSLDVICVYQSFECKVEKFNIQLHMIEDYINRDSKENGASIARMLLEEDYNIRTKEQFDADLNNVLSQLK